MGKEKGGRVIYRFMLLCLCSMAMSKVAAQEDTIVGKVHTVGEVLVESHAVNANVLSSAPIQSFGNRQLRELGIMSLADVVKRFAGASVRDYGGIGGLKTVSVRNLGAHHTAVSYDGVAIGNAQAGQIDIGRYTADNLSHVSFAIGQGADIMQSARHYASAGVLDIETQRPHFEKHPYHVSANVRGGSFGMVSPSVTYWQRIDKRTSLSCHGSYMRADGVYPFTLENGYVKTREKRYNSDVSCWQGEANLFHAFANGNEWQTKVAYYQSERGLPGTVILYNHDANERLWDKNFFVQTLYQASFSKKWRLHGRMKYNYAWDKYEDTNSKYQGGKQTDINRQHEYYVSATLGWQPTSHWSFALAEDVIANKLHNNFASNMQPLRLTSFTVLSSRYGDSRFQADGNLLFTFAHEHLKNGIAPDDRKRLSPSLSLSYRLIDGETLFARAMAKGTFRMPSFNDLYYQRIGNNKLQPERAMEYNVGMTWSHRFAKAIDFHATADLYYNKVYDKIVAFPSTYVWKMVNFGEVDITGLDVTMGVDVSFSKGINMQLLANYMLQNAIDKLDHDQQIPYTPKHSGNGSVVVHTPWITLGYTLMAQGKRYSNVTHRSEYRLRPFCEHSITLSHDFLWRGNKVSLSASILNLTDEQYEIVQYYPMPGRSWQVGIKVGL
ncbi:MAG: TonB-dependent receptor [Prevotella sp.]|nr:TonB-dependent receptor [Prevotella sp.]